MEKSNMDEPGMVYTVDDDMVAGNLWVIVGPTSVQDPDEVIHTETFTALDPGPPQDDQMGGIEISNNCKPVRRSRAKKNYICPTCGKKFSSQFQVTRHMTVHSGAKPYACEQCDKAFTQNAHLMIHMEVHNGTRETKPRPFSCEFCEKSFDRESKLKKHVVIHYSAKPFECDICDAAFKWAHSLKEHMLKHAGVLPYHCNVCDKGFYYKNACTRHVAQHSKDPSQMIKRKYPCTQCDKAFIQSSHLKAHLRSHTDDKPFQCEICDKRFKLKHSFTTHQLMHVQELGACRLQHVCDQCGKSFINKNNLRTHKYQVHKIHPYQCQDCEGEFRTKKELLQHQMEHVQCEQGEVKVSKEAKLIGDQLNKIIKESTIEVETETDQMLSAAEAKYLEIERVNEQISTKFVTIKPVTVVSLDAQTLDFISMAADDSSDVCGSAMPLLESIKLEHSIVDHSDMVEVDSMYEEGLDSVCDGILGLQSDVHTIDVVTESVPQHSVLDQLGMEEVSSPKPVSKKDAPTRNTIARATKFHKCTMCDKQFLSRYRLERHMHTHDGTRPYKCQVCDRGFTQKTNLEYHKKVHIGARQYKCSRCSRAFIRKDDLDEHERVHDNIKLSCEFCNETFNFRSNLHRHMQNNHWARKFECEKCGKGFARAADLKKHACKLTIQLDYKCVVCKQEFASEEDLRNHLETHQDVIVHKCPACWRHFTRLYLLRSHIMTHTGEKPYSCSDCGKCYRDLKSYKAHVTKHVGGKKTHACTVCEDSFVKQQALLNHMRKNHDVVT